MEPEAEAEATPETPNDEVLEDSSPDTTVDDLKNTIAERDATILDLEGEISELREELYRKTMETDTGDNAPETDETDDGMPGPDEIMIDDLFERD